MKPGTRKNLRNSLPRTPFGSGHERGDRLSRHGNLVEAELAKPWYASRSASLVKVYNRRREPYRRADARYTMWVAVVIYISFALLDFVLIPDVAEATTGARILFGAAAFCIVEAFIKAGARASHLEATCAGIIVACYVAWLSIAVYSIHTLSVSYYMVFGTIFMMVASLLFNFKPIYAIFASILVTLAFFVAMIFVITVSLNYALAFSTFYLSCFSFTAYVNWKLNLERYRVFLNAFQAERRQEELAERRDTLLRLSNTDPLTGLMNRRAIDEKLRQFWSTWLTTSTPFAVVLADIDFFKSFNDYHGHQEGDRCLVYVGKALQRAIAPYNGLIGRYGGEEFIILAPLADDSQLKALAETVRSAVADITVTHPHRKDGENIVTASVGASMTRRQSSSKVETLLNEADRALYSAKASGRNCVHLFDPSDPKSGDDSEAVAALLRTAIDRHLVSLVYQPIQSLPSGRVDAVESLMRLRMLDGTDVPPSVFIPIAERTGAILELGRWAIDTVCQELLSNRHIAFATVNISVVQLRAPGFSKTVEDILNERRVPGTRLAIEVTEGLDLELNSEVLRSIGALRQLGVRIWLDDFGTGFAGLSWLRLIDFDTVKIDRSFINNLSNTRDATMLNDIIALIRNRGPQILVEGVETCEQMKILSNYEVDYIQGYYVGRPVPSANVESIIAPQGLQMSNSL
ncbi:putative bifunctional diguanylate cyclase/phosphodiesterase [Aurantimonas endophytica]|uniref:Diguanylate cyclase (GGDEF)-like protein n=1 Tax=Aurantimonas endophytica TaxID=1522175 RepID=A0A7W6MR60_9HYPH|nr:EAL domain-containing protein [Aurantimonas endophytica]MBB4004700.1 diguanylate cyclase (GGDEF)-like protein [Aurantimonas endophytica]MCO6405516.1 EAL domain-containing protein [Aurantimonas endophytica]